MALGLAKAHGDMHLLQNKGDCIMTLYKHSYAVSLLFFILACSNCFSQTPDSLYPFHWKGKVGYIDKNFAVIIQPQFNSGSTFIANKALVTLDGYYAIINIKGEIQKKFSDAEKMQLMEEGFLLYRKADKWVILDANYKEIFSTTKLIDSLYYYDFIEDGRILVKTDNGDTFIDREGRFVFGATYFNYASGFSEGLAMVQRKPNDKKGFIDPEGKFAIEPQYDGVLANFSEGICPVRKDGKTFYINKRNEVVSYVDMDYAYPFQDGVGLIAKGMSFNPIWSMINIKGEYLLKDLDAYVEPIREGFAVFHAPVIRTPKYIYKYGFLNTKGEIAVKPQFDKAGSFYNGLAEIWIADEQGFIDTQGKVIWVKDFMN
jgi:hypothetical protein